MLLGLQGFARSLPVEESSVLKSSVVERGFQGKE